ncbi:uncharacterized protein [Diadema antillarum]|uniref:uncharacterized protein n=1 Tax=Diadema antillarum TaxID=105358 RepID=UPI003A8746A0
MAGTNSNTQSTTKIPTVLWAQREDCLLLTIEVPKAVEEDITFEPEKVHLKCKGGLENEPYELEFEFHKDISPKTSKYKIQGRHIDMLVKKKESGPYWPRLTKESKKQHWLRTDFSRWKDEDESDDEFGGGDDRGLNEMLANMGNMGDMGGMGGMGGMGMGDMGSMGETGGGESDDSDDEEIPELEDTDGKEGEGRSE